MRVSGWVLPLLVALAALLGVGGARYLAAPSFTRDYGVVPAGRPETVRFVVRGLKCVDTARTLGAALDGTPGVLRYVAYASRHEALVVYDRAVADRQTIRAAIEGPIVDEVSGDITFRSFEVVAINGHGVR